MESKYDNTQLNYQQMEMMNKIQTQSVEKVKEFKARLSSFEGISTIEEAKALAKSIMPVSQEVNHFKVGNARCVIINKPDLFRLSMDSEEEFISYDFS